MLRGVNTVTKATMDIDEYVKRSQPRAKRSRLIPFAEQIMKLRTSGFTHQQITEWLETNGVKVTQESVRKFIKSRQGKPTGTANPAPKGAERRPSPTTSKKAFQPTEADTGEWEDKLKAKDSILKDNW